MCWVFVSFGRAEAFCAFRVDFQHCFGMRPLARRGGPKEGSQPNLPQYSLSTP